MRVSISEIVPEFQSLKETGVQLKGNYGKEHIAKLFAICCSADAPTKADNLNSLRMNGYHECCWCLHSGDLVIRTVNYEVS